MTIPFQNIPANLRVPLFYAEVDNSRANTAPATQRALLIAPIAGTPPAGTTLNVPQLVAGDGKDQGGARSILSQMVAAYRANDPFGELWVLPVADPAGANASGTLALTGTATAAGTLMVYVGGRRYAVSVAVGATASAVATSLAALVNADGDAFVSAAASTGTVTFTAVHKGTIGNDIDIRLNYRGTAAGEVTPAGLTVVITAMSGGTLVPTLTTALANLGPKSYDFIVCPYNDATTLDALKDLLSDTTGRWSYAAQLYGHVFAAARGNVAALQTLGTARNNQHETLMGFYDSPTPVWVWAAAVASSSAVGLRNDPGRPLQTLAVAGVLPPPVQSRFAFSNRNTLLYSGISTFSVADDGTVALENVITTYQTNKYGVADNSYLEVETMFTLAFVLRFMQGAITSKFARVKLAANGTRFAAGSPIVTPNIIRAELIAQYRELESLGMVQNADAFKAGLIVEQNQQNPNRVDVLWPGTLISQLRIFALLAQFRLI